MPLVLNSSGGGSVTLSAPSTASNVTLTAPASNATLITTASTGQIVPKAAMPTGSVLQVASVTKSDIFSTTSTSFVDITGLSVNITPSSATSKILISYQIQGTADINNSGVYFRLMRDATPINVGDAAGSRPRVSNFGSSINVYGMVVGGGPYLDSPATTSSITYKIQMYNSASTTSYINRSQSDRDSSLYDGRVTSTITVMEIAA